MRSSDSFDPASSVRLLALRDSLHRHRTSLPGGTVTGPSIEDCLAPPQGSGEIGRLGVYRVLSVLGEGGMGRVYEAEDTRLRRRVALKILRPVLASDGIVGARFFREAELLASMSHRHIASIFDVGMAPAADGQLDLPYLAMQLLQGETLEASVLRRGRIAAPEAIRIVRQTAEGLAVARERSLIHRDIKPANLWLESPDGAVKILDFGLARELASSTRLSQSGLMLGTPAFMAPEQARGDTLDSRADLFSLGCVLYTILAGEVPFDGPSVMAVLTRLAVYDPPPLAGRFPEISQGLSSLVMRLLAKEPGDRPASAQVLIADLDALSAHASVQKTQLSIPTALPATPAVKLPRPSPLALGGFLNLRVGHRIDGGRKSGG